MLPFKYRGRRYNKCAKTRRGRPWCPTGSGVYVRNQPWGYCRGGKRKDQPSFDCLSVILLSLLVLTSYEFPRKRCLLVSNESRKTICRSLLLYFKCQFCDLIFRLNCYFEMSSSCSLKFKFVKILFFFRSANTSDCWCPW